MTNDYNNIYVNSTIGNTYIGYYNGNRSTLSNWQSGTGDGANSLDLNPVIFKESYTPNFSLIDNKGNFTATHDVDSNLRSVSTPDMGAVEFSGVLGDIALLDVWIKEKNNCLVLDDTAYATIENVFENTIDFSTTPITVTWEITGPNNSTLSKTINSGTLLKGNELNVFATPANMVDTGIYTIKAYLSLAAVNGKAFNDTITGNIFEKEDFKLALNSKNDTIRNIIDSVFNSASISYHSQPTFFFTEIAQYNSTSTGQPIGGRPSWLIGSEYIEITGTPNADLEGYTMEIWKGSSMAASYTFQEGTVLNSQGTAVVSTSITSNYGSAANFFYALSPTYHPGYYDATGRILKDSNGNIIDAIIYYNYEFPTSSGVDSTIWTGELPIAINNWGYRLEGRDRNNAKNWVMSTSAPQNPNSVNSGIEVPFTPDVSKVKWTDLSTNTIVDTTLNPVFGPYANNGEYNYEI